MNIPTPVKLADLKEGELYFEEIFLYDIFCFFIIKIEKILINNSEKRIEYLRSDPEEYYIFSDILDFPDEKIEYEIVSPPHRVFHKRHITIVYSYPERMLRIRKRFFLLDEKFLKKFLKNKNWIINEHENISLSKPIFKIILESDKNNSEC